MCSRLCWKGRRHIPWGNLPGLRTCAPLRNCTCTSHQCCELLFGSKFRQQPNLIPDKGGDLCISKQTVVDNEADCRSQYMVAKH